MQFLIQLNNGNGGRRVILDMKPEEMLEICKKYSFGLFMLNENGRFYSILSLEDIEL